MNAGERAKIVVPDEDYADYEDATELRAEIEMQITNAVAEEREACLRIVDEYVGDYGDGWEKAAVYIHNAIRVRGQSGQTGPVSG